MSDFIATITQAGITAAINAHSGQINIAISHIAVGTSGYTPTRGRTSLVNEIDRVPVHSSESLSQDQWRVMGSFETGEYTAREVGFFLEDGTLFALFSDPANPIFYKTQGATVIQPFTLALKAVPADAITVNASSDMRFFLGQEFMRMTTAQTHVAASNIATMHRQITLIERVNKLEGQ